jgi:hypothetical protein
MMPSWLSPWAVIAPAFLGLSVVGMIMNRRIQPSSPRHSSASPPHEAPSARSRAVDLER